MSVATDPAFPDPRVTPEPPPPPAAPPPPAPDRRPPMRGPRCDGPPIWRRPRRRRPSRGAPDSAPTRLGAPSPAVARYLALDTPYPGPEAEDSAGRMEASGP